MERIPISMAKRRTVAEKREILNYAEEHSIHKAEKKYLVHRSTIRYLKN